MAAPFQWLGDRFRKHVEDNVAVRLEMAGASGVEVARGLVPVDTGRTRDSIGFTFNRSTLTLQIYADTRWAVFLEMGTSRTAARPFLRPALAAVGRAFGGDINAQVGLPNASANHPVGKQGRRLRFRAKRS